MDYNRLVQSKVGGAFSVSLKSKYMSAMCSKNSIHIIVLFGLQLNSWQCEACIVLVQINCPYNLASWISKLN